MPLQQLHQQQQNSETGAGANLEISRDSPSSSQPRSASGVAGQLREIIIIIQAKDFPL